MIDGVKLIDCKLTPDEWGLIELIRAIDIEFGELPITVIFQQGRIEGIKYKDPTIRKHIKGAK